MCWQISECSEKVERVWKHRGIGWFLFVVFVAWCLWWKWHIPSIGYAIGALAVVASVMAALMENLKGLARFSWIILLFGFLWVEMKAIDNDKKETAKKLSDQFTNISQLEQNSLRRILDQEHMNLQNILTNEQIDLSQTTTQLLRQEREQAKEFNAILVKQQQLFERQQDFTEFLTGKLLPASDSTPIHNCGPLLVDDVILFFGTNAAVTNKFPHTILEFEKQSLISIDRNEAGSFILNVEMRDTSNKIIARLNKDGFIANNAYILRPDKSTVIVEDQFGKEILNARFLNPHAFRIGGVLQYGDKKMPLTIPFMSNSCLAHNGIDFAIH